MKSNVLQQLLLIFIDLSHVRSTYKAANEFVLNRSNQCLLRSTKELFVFCYFPKLTRFCDDYYSDKKMVIKSGGRLRELGQILCLITR